MGETKQTPRNRKPLDPETYDYHLGLLRQGRPTALSRAMAYQLAADVDAHDEQRLRLLKALEALLPYAESRVEDIIDIVSTGGRDDDGAVDKAQRALEIARAAIAKGAPNG